MKSIVTLLMTVLSYAILYGQEVTVTGEVQNQDGQPIPFAHVVFTNVLDSLDSYGAVALDGGGFEIVIPREVYWLNVMTVGSKPLIKEIDLTEVDSPYFISEIMVEVNIDLKEHVVTAYTSNYGLDLDKKVYDVSKDIANRGGTLSDVMENVPSVQIGIDGSVSIRGNGNVTILIDGKPSGLTSTTSLLRTIPSNAIERIEVLTNPSSKYGSEGEGGIINVVMKKGDKKNQTSSAEVFAGWPAISGVNFNINRKREKLTWRVNSRIGYEQPRGNNQMRVSNLGFEPEMYILNGKRKLGQRYFASNIGGDWQLNDRSSLNFDLALRIANLNTVNHLEYADFSDESILNLSERENNEVGDEDFVQATSEYMIKINEKGSRLAINIVGQLSNEFMDAEVNERATFPIEQLLISDLITNDVGEMRYAASADFTSLGKNESKTEVGARFRSLFVRNDYAVSRTVDEESLPIPELTDKTSYREEVIAFYSQFMQSVRRVKFQFGIRLETTLVEAHTEKNQNQASRNYTDFFPSANLTYQFTERKRMRFSVSRRIQRPRRNVITPFRSYSDSRNVFLGNPEIDPSYSIIAEVGYELKTLENLEFTPTVFYRNTKDVMLYLARPGIISVDGMEQNVFVTQTVNVGTHNSLGLELSSSYQPNDWLKVYNETTFSFFNQRGIVDERVYESDGLFVYGRLNLTFSLSNGWQTQMQHRYANGRTRGQIESSGIYRMDLGFSKKLLDERASITLNLRDVFDTWEWHIRKEEATFIQELDVQGREPQLNLTFTYRWN